VEFAVNGRYNDFSLDDRKDSAPAQRVERVPGDSPDAILDRWREAADADPEQTTVASLNRAQFNDHIPQVLDAFERQLRSRPGGDRAAAAGEETRQEDVKHGLHRWQQGYRLRELMHEWGHLHRCIFEEVEHYGSTHPEVERETLAAAHRALIVLVSDAVSESSGQYARLQQDEAAGHVRDLERALAQLNGLERHRGEMIRQAVHDLGGNVQTVSTAATLLGFSDLKETERNEYVDLLQSGAGALRDMLRDLMDLARLEAGQDRREITSFNAASILLDLRRLAEPLAREAAAGVQHRGFGVVARRWRSGQSPAYRAESRAERDQVHREGERGIELGRRRPDELVDDGKRHRTGADGGPGRADCRRIKGSHRERA
jgi:signal transduction histidine kinase